jgi:hypothetical protein
MSYNFRTVMGQSSYRSWKQWNEGDYLVGKYISTGEDSFGNPNYKVEVIEAGFDSGEAPKVGAVFTFNSAGALNKAFEEIEKDEVVKVIYRGEDTITKGKFKGKKFHSMEVMVAGTKVETPEDSDELI